MKQWYVVYALLYSYDDIVIPLLMLQHFDYAFYTLLNLDVHPGVIIIPQTNDIFHNNCKTHYHIT